MVSIETVFCDYFIYQPLQEDDDDFDIADINGFRVTQTFANEAVDEMLTYENVRNAVEALENNRARQIRELSNHEEHMQIHREYLESLINRNASDIATRILGQYEYTET